MMETNRHSNRETGLSLLEVMVSLSLAAGILIIFTNTVVDSMDFSVHNVGRADLHEIARRSVETIRKDVSRTGWFTLGAGTALPYVSTNGDPQDSMFDPYFKHDVTTMTAISSSFVATPPPPPGAQTPAFVAPEKRLAPTGIGELIFWVPSKDEKGNFTFDATGGLAMAPELVAFLLIPNAHGTFNLVRRRANFGVWPPQIENRTICTHVEAMTFDTVTTKPNLPFDAVEIHLHMKRKGSRGETQRVHTATTVMMRNSRT